ncbi:MAG: hypothetical protein UV74_C0013G0369 [Candidatus Woesebacteria bacterium GW2011_GWB1_43_14]|uniref:Glycosyltransferase RgtA/B/C/D-like domain-containing protein n=1 Tax=Candidatus Woesebacteria bacterium GW2011_GWB1_43_14 TaxID=1618578 RepID=A0A0G1DI44_9BACT|nr:MAG: hypothetical protein UT21_C0001G0079 [Candidatus Woesebacteria bacterium GW2011_GWA1_39_11b]KKS78335.1 MAG: hypothetical protein UV51_C0001G0051 [Candidatus Woesebacteria bacterium GW2011_GWC1_42_9]KKS97247.1 MAG: hypothetical protein UV74_C0013G0369 [Candidatus Woesebacteria bacterium GW2011_GWB1_43_14]
MVMNKIVLFVLGLAFFLRIYGLSNHPAGFTPDEASFGYDAYSILRTGRDQWGNFFPLSFKSFGDYKMPIYGYLTIPSVAIFGLNEFAVRLPNAILGILAVLGTYLLVDEVFKDKRTAYLTAFLLAVSSWHISMSRGAFEANLTTFFMPFGIFLFYKGVKNSKYFIWSATFFGLNLFTYHSARLVTPLIVGYLIVDNRANLKLSKKMRFPIGIFGLFCIGALYTYLTGSGSRAVSAGIFSLASNVGGQRYGAVMVGLPDFLARVFNNKLTYLFSIFLGNYVSYFSPQFLFTQGAGEGTYGMLPGRGLLYLIELPLLVGFVWGWASGKIKKVNWLVVWLLIAPVPAALSIGPGYAANRAVIMMPAISIILGLGGVHVFKELARYIDQKILVFIYLSMFLLGFVFFIEDYFIQQPSREAKTMIYGQRELFGYLAQIEGDYHQIIISKKISEGHVYLSFYNGFDPAEYQSEINSWGFDEGKYSWVDQIPKYTLGKFVFQNIDWSFHSRVPQVLLVGEPGEFPESTEAIKKILYPNKTEAYWIVAPTQELYANNK